MVKSRRINTDKMLLTHILRGHVREYDIVQTDRSETLSKYEDLFERNNIKFKSLAKINAEKTGGKRIFNKIGVLCRSGKQYV